MHILYFHQHFSTPKGAAGTRSYEMAKRLLLQGHQVTMVCGSYSQGNTGLEQKFIKGRREGMVDGIRVIEFELNYSNKDNFFRRTIIFAKYAFASIWLAMWERYDIAFATTTPLTAGIPGIFARWLRNKTFIFEVRDLWPELPRSMGVIKNPLVLWLMAVLEWISYRSAHRCVALSPGIAKGIEKCGIASNKIALIPNGCDIEIFQKSSLKSWRPEPISNDDFMAVFSGTHGQANGLSAILDAAKILKKRRRDDIKIVLIGDGKLKPNLVARAEAEGLNNIIFVEPVAKERLAGLLKSADIGIQCLANVPAFYYGTSPNKFFDYIAAGLPVLNNYPGWLAELINEYDCGWVVEPDNAIAFANALEDAAKNRNILAKKGKNASSLAISEFNRKILADKWVNWVTKGELV